MLAAVHARWAATRREEAATSANIKGGTQSPPHRSGGGLSPPCNGIFVTLEGAGPFLGTRTTTARDYDDFFLSPTFVHTLAAELAVDEVFGSFMSGAVAALGKLVNRLGTPVADHGSACAPKGGTPPA
jgi:hypothetical protein